MTTNRDVRDYVEKHIGSHKHQYQLLGVSKGGRTYSFVCIKCFIIQFYQKTGVISVVTGHGKKWRKRWTKGYSASDVLETLIQEAKDKEAFFFLSNYKKTEGNDDAPVV